MSLTLELSLDRDGGYGGVILLCDDTEAMRLSRIMKFPWTPNCKVYVTINWDGLTGENCYANSQVEGGDANTGSSDPSLFDAFPTREGL